ncbi:protein-glutamine gamma-glutamyltransferase 2-like [Acipenser ruthenus]|uniref:protein-glutamine gamma-glutamyltransferase 2-like n=1 Tax=Acipenser ruthenus TaxID=7906 RepID=UPI0027413B79|nr:protein-glutamine gamma-glutamyltransferase 2-like [Acipenser ruthenus]
MNGTNSTATTLSCKVQKQQPTVVQNKQLNHPRITTMAALDIERCELECEINNFGHRTYLNGRDRLIVRRGQPFTITLHLRSGQFQPGVTTFSFVAETGPCPCESAGTKTEFSLSGAVDLNQWSAAVSCHSGNTVSLSICSPPDARIGRYSLTMTQGGSTRLGDFILLFNPWCPGDSVYMEDEEELKEYVLTQDGLIFRGTEKHITHCAWNFGQFEPGILDACLQVLDMNPKYLSNADQDCSKRNDPIYVSRVVSAMINCNDDKGVLAGNWGDCSDGVNPMSWNGSVEILRNWCGSYCQPVKYGQCWVFAAVGCTVLRALGIPSRVVTNFLSAHDSNSNLIIEQYYDENGTIIKKTRDSIWNFHCWVESWMTRPDLKPGFDGWQASDPTPQERSEGVFCCGPISVKAIKEGELTFKYDAPFVFAEVNADVVYWVKHKDGSQKKMSFFNRVGQRISTKSVGKDVREDITHLYKYPEGSEEERHVFEKANHQNMLLKPKPAPGLHLKIKVTEGMRNGCDFDVYAVVTNNTPKPKLCRLMFCARAARYNSTVGEECGMKDLLNMQIPPNEEKQIPLRLNYSKYCEAITEDNLIKLVALLIDYETKDAMLAVRDIYLENPEIKIKILGEPKQNRKLAAEITLKNPLSEPLQGCLFCVEGANLTDGKAIQEPIASVSPGQEAKVKVYFTPKQSGLRKLVVDFNSNKLRDVKGYKNIIIGK